MERAASGQIHGTSWISCGMEHPGNGAGDLSWEVWKVKRIAVAALVMLLLLLAGIAAAAVDAGTLQKVIEKGVVRVGVLPDYPPWGYRGSKGEFEGYDVDIAKKLAEALEVKLEILPLEAPARVPSLVSGKVDVVIACITPTNVRAKVVDFTIPYAAAGLVPMVKAGNTEIKSYKDLAGKEVAVVRGGTPDQFTLKAVPTVKLVRFDTIADAYSAFKSGKVNIFVEEDSFVYLEALKNPELKAVGEPFSRELISFAVKKNDQDWLNYLNNFLTNLRFTGENDELFKKWFGAHPAPLTLK